MKDGKRTRRVRMSPGVAGAHLRSVSNRLPLRTCLIRGASCKFPSVLDKAGMGWYVRMAVFIPGKTVAESEQSQHLRASTRAGTLTAHSRIHASDIDEQSQHGKIDGEHGGLGHLVFQDLGGFGRVQYRVHVELSEGDLGTGGGVVPRVRVGKDSMRICEDGVEKVELDVDAGEGLAVCMLDRDDLAGGGGWTGRALVVGDGHRETRSSGRGTIT